MKKLLFFIALLLGTFTFTFAQNEKKLSAGTRMVIAQRDGKMATAKVAKQQFIKKNNLKTPVAKRGKAQLKPQQIGTFGTATTLSADEDSDDGATFAEPFISEGVEKVQVWVKLTDNNLSALENIAGVKVTAKFDKLVTANVPVKALEQVAALKNVTKVSVATMFKKETYYGREATNVDDVLNYTADAQAAGLLQAYDGTGVVIGIIDGGIQFDHQMFKDANGNTRIKKAIVYDSDSGELNEYSTQSAIEALTYDYTGTSHGSHTSSIAGGSNFSITAKYWDTESSSIVNGSRTYGGMAPGTDLFLCGLAGQYTSTNIAYCVQKISEYADQVGKPCVISMSLGSQAGPHDGTGYLTDVCSQYMNGPGKIFVNAASNDAGTKIYHYGNAIPSSPVMSIIDCTALDAYTSGNYTLNNIFLYGGALSYARTPNIELAARAYVVNTSTNTILWVSNEYSADIEIGSDTEGVYGGTFGTYFESALNDNDDGTNDGGYLYFYFDQDDHSGKYSIQTLAYYLCTTDSYISQDDYTLTGNLKIGVCFYPKNEGSSTYIDSWGLNSSYFESATAIYNGSSYTFTEGNDLCSISNFGTSPYLIPIGSYTTMLGWVSEQNQDGYYYAVDGTIGDIASSSGYQAPGYGPLGTKLPVITAPGEMVIAAFNKGYVANNTTSTSLIKGYDANNPLGVNAGTSMATPCAGGIVALWLQVDPTLTIEDVKTLMQETAIQDSYVTGTNANMFGNGKIDALAGIEALLGDDPQIGATPQAVTMAATVGNTTSETVSVHGANLTTQVNITLNDPNGVFSIDKAYMTRAKAESEEGAEFTITFAPTVAGTYTATVTLSSTGANDVIVTINGTATEAGGTAADAYLNIAKYATIDEQGWGTSYVTNLYKYTEYKTDNVAWLTLPVYGAAASIVYSPKAQNWIKASMTSLSTSGNGSNAANTTWNATDIHQGSSTYFTSTTARAIYGSDNTSTTRTVTFYVTNTTAVKLLGKNGKVKGQKNTYPTTLTIYECTENVDGTLTESTTAVTTQSGGVTTNDNNIDINLSYSDLDATKIYKVVASIYRGYLYEIAFQTPLKSAEIIATPTSLTFDTPVGVPVSQTFNVKGNELEGDITATLTTNQGNVYSLDANSVTVAEAESGSGKDVTVTFSPTTAGTFTGTVTLTSSEADPVTVNLTGVAHQPVIEADPTSLSFETEVGVAQSLTFDVLAQYLSDGITVTLADENGVFSVDASSISIAEAEDGKTVTVTFNPSEFGTFTGTVTLSAPYAEDAVVTLNGVATQFFDVKISDVGLTTLYLDYPVEIPYDEYDPDILGVFYIYEINGKELKAARLYETIPANTGVIIQGNSNTAECPAYRFPRVAEADPLTRSSYLSGSVVNTTVAAVLAETPGTIYTLGRGSDTYINFYRYSGKNLAANKAFLILGGNNAKGFSLVVDGEEATGIKALDTVTDDGAWYTVEGIKLQGKPTRKGVYLHNGKSVIMK